MTLSTEIYVHDEIDHRKVFTRCQQLIGAHEGVRWTDRQDETWRKGESFVEPGNPWRIGNDLGQGLCALLDISYRPGAPLRTEESVVAHRYDCSLPGGDWDFEPYCTSTRHDEPCWLVVDFDTAYSYRGDEGEGCGDLHARLVAELGAWLDGQGIGWSWQNEFTGEVHQRYEGLAELSGEGRAASAWFHQIVAPVIAAHGGVL